MVIIGNSFEHYCCRWECEPLPQGYERPARLIALASAGLWEGSFSLLFSSLVIWFQCPVPENGFRMSCSSTL